MQDELSPALREKSHVFIVVEVPSIGILSIKVAEVGEVVSSVEANHSLEEVELIDPKSKVVIGSYSWEDFLLKSVKGSKALGRRSKRLSSSSALCGGPSAFVIQARLKVKTLGILGPKTW